MVCVAPNLYLGNAQASRDRDLLRRMEIVAVCCVGAPPVFKDDLQYHRVSIEDDGQHSMLPHFDRACDFIHEHRKRGSVFVHCKGGISRSPTMVVAYLMRFGYLFLHEAAEACSLARPAANPQHIFLQDLIKFEAIVQRSPDWMQSRLTKMSDHEETEEERQQEEADVDEQVEKDEDSLWDDAVGMATAETMCDINPEPRAAQTIQEVQAECKRLLDVLEQHCILACFGQARPANTALQDAAKKAVKAYAKSQEWHKVKV